MKITEILLVEHQMMRALFANVETLLPTLMTLQEIHLVTQIIEGVLDPHGKGEEDFLFSAYNQICQQKKTTLHSYQEHKDIHSSLVLVKNARQPAHARELLKMALLVSREHFNREERGILPLIEKTMSPQTLEDLGQAWLKRE